MSGTGADTMHGGDDTDTFVIVDGGLVLLADTIQDF